MSSVMYEMKAEKYFLRKQKHQKHIYDIKEMKASCYYSEKRNIMREYMTLKYLQRGIW